MGLPAIKYSDYEYYQALCNAGCSEKIAQVHTKHHAGVMAMINQENDIIKSNIQHLEVEVIKVQQQVTALDERMKHGFEKVEQKFSVLDDKIEQKFSVLDDKIEQKISALDDKIEQKITSLDQKTQSSIRELAISTKLAINELQYTIESISNKLFLRLSGVVVAVVGLFHSLHSFI